jgi:hypothetical protein
MDQDRKTRSWGIFATSFCLNHLAAIFLVDGEKLDPRCELDWIKRKRSFMQCSKPADAAVLTEVRNQEGVRQKAPDGL